MLAKKKEKDVIDRMLDQIDFHGMIVYNKVRNLG